MSNSNNHEDHNEQHGGWQPTPQGGEYDSEATAFVHLPPEDLASAPLAAPGHGYVPPMILPLTPAAGLDPAATGSWVVQTRGLPDGGAEQQAQGEVHWPDPNQQHGYPQHEQHSPGEQYEQHSPGEQYPQHVQHSADEQYPQHEQHSAGEQYAQHERHGEPSAATGQWDFTEATPAESLGHTGQWTIPVAEGELPDESGEFTTSALASQWYADRTPPATLPGGAPAPWATQPEPAPEAAETAVGTPAHGVDVSQVPAPESTRVHVQRDADAEPPTEPAADPTADLAPDASPDLGPDLSTDLVPGVETDTDTPAAALAAEEVPADAPALDPQPLDTWSEHPAASYVLHVNGADRPVTDAWIGESLLYVLRERLGLAGAKDGCSQGECGACNVQVDGRLVASCLVPAATAAGSEVRTVEGLAVDGEPSDVQRALANCGAVQCGFCIPGMAMTVHDLLEGNHAPSELETRQALCGNLCRCSGYRGVLDAVSEVIAGREASAEAAAVPGPTSSSAEAHADEARIPHQAAPGAGSVQPHLQDGGMA
ncbi:Aerobic-type carbon monoxide dehydrogenase, small subunit, CoxS/CutS family [Streptomyces sp. 136MFCol5.1]|uniref:2Fe-2S iron-sulfur cluster-binding protein n=1 Tax=Streptomyces sp. 136MFCol5.1 TaxID=1172182 RepID=UPI0008871707|nr:(2Fe-2S)-binding protein [Streptomyces sp. 136MFCol5.1]SCZ06576.1 Aerobic-type carbon monoxide dehydrogenase, small subunit, CoxS/CutS family [Streptomyces sp. 136MFCol5.1]